MLGVGSDQQSEAERLSRGRHLARAWQTTAVHLERGRRQPDAICYTLSTTNYLAAIETRWMKCRQALRTKARQLFHSNTMSSEKIALPDDQFEAPGHREYAETKRKFSIPNNSGICPIRFGDTHRVKQQQIVGKKSSIHFLSLLLQMGTDDFERLAHLPGNPRISV